MRQMEQVEFTNMCMVRDAQGRMLMQKRVGSWPGYALPGGHVEYGESMTDAVIREVREETGLTIIAPTLCGVKDWMQEDGSRYVVLLYSADQYTGEVTSSEEGEVRWVARDELPTLTLSKGMGETLKVYYDQSISEQWFDKDQDYAQIMK